MPAYFIAEVQVTNAAGYDSYRPLAGASIAQYGGKFLVRGGPAELLEGTQQPARIVVIEFADTAAVMKCLDLVIGYLPHVVAAPDQHRTRVGPCPACCTSLSSHQS